MASERMGRAGDHGYFSPHPSFPVNGTGAPKTEQDSQKALGARLRIKIKQK